MASEQYSGGTPAEEENTKHSFMSKVKSKAKKLKSKLKPHDSADSSGQAPAPRDPLDHYTTGSADQDGNESDTSSSSDEEEKGNQHASEGTPFGAVSSGQTAVGADSRTDDKSFPVDPTVLKSGGSPGIQEAVPTNYSYFNADPEQARLPSDTDASRQRGVPSTGGNPFAERESTLSKLGDRESELPLSSSADDSAERNNVGLVEPSRPSQDSLLSHPIEQDQGVSDKDNEGYGGLAAAAATAAGVGGVAAGTHDRSYTESEGDSFAPDTTNKASGVEGATDTNVDVPPQELTWTQKIYNTVVGAKDTVASHPVTQSVVSHPVTQKATETAYGVKDTAAIKLGYADEVTSTDSTPISAKATDSAIQAKDSKASTLSANDEQKPFTDRVTESAYGLKDAVVSHPATQTAAAKLGYADLALSTDSTPVSEKGLNSAVQAKDSAASNLPANEQRPLTDRVTEGAYGLKDTVVSHPVTQTVASKLGYGGEALSTDSTPLSMKVTDSAYEAKDSAASNLSANDGAQKPLTDRVTESAYGLKDTVASHPVTKQAYDLKDTVVSHPVTQQATNYAVQGKNFAANQLSYADQALSSDDKPVSAKTYEAAAQARDTAVQKTAPDHHDKALADSVTESISALPALLTSKLGLGGGTIASSPTTASTTPTDVSTRKDTPFPDHSAAASPGIIDRVSGLASSLFGSAAKQPATEADRPAPVEKYIP